MTIQVREFADRRVFVGGEVTRPGMQPLVGQQTALGAVMEAGGFRSRRRADSWSSSARATKTSRA